MAGTPVVKEMEDDKKLIDEIGRYQNEFNAKDAKCKENETAIKSFIAGQDERRRQRTSLEQDPTDFKASHWAKAARPWHPKMRARLLSETPDDPELA